MTRRLVLALVVIAVAAAAGRADSILFKDGRYYEVPKAVEGQEGLRVIYENGEVLVRSDLIREVHLLDAGGEYTPRTEEERVKVEKGLVPFGGRWITRSRRDSILEERRQKRQEALEQYRSHMLWRNRYKGSTRHFNFEYTVPRDIAEDYMEMFEAYYQFFAKDWGVRQPSRLGKLRVCFYNTMDDFNRIGDVPKGVLGYFRFVEPLELNFFYERRDERLTLDVLFHETNHYVMHLYTTDDFNLAPWIEEGLAEYYGASTWDPETKRMTIGNIQEGRLVRIHDAMDGDAYQDLENLMSAPSISAMQYAWAWSLNHMLLESKKWGKKYRKYVARMARDKGLPREPWPVNPTRRWVEREPAIRMFEKALGIKDLEAFEKDWYDYIRGMEVTSDRGYHEAGLFCVRWGRPVRATLYFRKAIEMGTKNPGTYEELGKVLVRRGMFDEAVASLEKGIEMDPLNPYLHMALGKALVLSGDKGKEEGKRRQSLAIEMDPDDNRLLWEADVLREVVTVETDGENGR